jgi:hypothetical protein
MLRVFLLCIIYFAIPIDAFAERKFVLSIPGAIYNDAMPYFDCAKVRGYIGSAGVDAQFSPSCETVAGKLKAENSGVSIPFTITFPSPDGRVMESYTWWYGSCKSGKEVGSYLINTAYIRTDTEQELQRIQYVADVRFSKGGCVVKAIDIPEGGCAAYATSTQNVSLSKCSAMFVETGEIGDSSDGEPSKGPNYSGGIPPGSPGTGGDPGGGTDPGGGGTDPGGGGTTPGGGGTTPGGGGTTPGGGGTTPGGGTGGSGGTADFCALHPNLTVCKLSSVSGSCGSIQCNGDAVQCAAYREAALARCDTKLILDDLRNSELSKLSDRVLSGDDPLKDSLPSPDKAQIIDMKSLDKGGFLGGGSCFPDKTIVIMGRSVVIPFSEACSGLIALRFAVMIMASMACFKMLRSTFLGD